MGDTRVVQETVRDYPSVQMRDVWTVGDVLALDVEDHRRYEVVDGALIVSPPPGVPHGVVISRLMRILQSAAPSDVEVFGGALGVEFARSYRIPDLLVVRAEAVRTRDTHLLAGDVLLAVEVVSPGSVTTDRVTKPAQYAAAAISAFWRIETDPYSLSAYELAGDVYREVGCWGAGETARLIAPFPVDIDIDRLRPDR